MNYIRALLIISIKKNKLLTLADIAATLGISRQRMNYIKDNEITAEHKKKLEDELGASLEYNTNMADAVELKYITKNIKNPAITTLWVDRELVRNIWRKDENDLKIIQMPGDTMNGGEAPFRNEDILIVDTSVQNVLASGIYAYSTQKGALIFVNGIKQKADGSVKFFYKNPNYKEIFYAPEELKKMDFKVIGRVVKNVSLEV